jgi:hypothetical protein
VIQGCPRSLPLSFLDLQTVEGHDLRKRGERGRRKKEELGEKMRGRGGR